MLIKTRFLDPNFCLISISLITTLICGFSVSSIAAQLPNIVLIFTDDLGYGDLGSFGNPTSNTPAIDTMAAEGVRFTDFCVSQPVCSASRASLLTGCYANRLSIHGALGPHAKHGLSSAETTLAEVCKLSLIHI